MNRVLFTLLLSVCAPSYGADAADVSCISSFCLDPAITDKILVDSYGAGHLVPAPRPRKDYARCYYLAQDDAWVELYFNSPKAMTAVIVSRLRQCATHTRPAGTMAADFLKGKVRLGMQESDLFAVLGKPSQIAPMDATVDYSPIIDPRLGDVVHIYLASEDWAHLVYLKDGSVVGFGLMPPL